MTKPRPPRRGPAKAFTLLELLVSMTVLALLGVILVGILDSTSKVSRRTRSGVEAYQSARTAFEAITSRIAQATLNTYYSYDDPNAPSRYLRQSELHFLSAPSADVLPAGTLGGSNPGHALFFQLPGGYNPGAATEELNNLLNACGYFVAFTPEDEARLALQPSPPGFVSPGKNPRYRLIEVLQPSQSLSVYDDSTGKQWITDMVTKPTASGGGRFGVLADNIILLVFLPKLAPGDDVSGTALAPGYAYDSRTDTKISAKAEDGSTTKSSSLHQLPPLVEVLMIALEPESARRLAEKNGDTPPDLGTLPSSGRFTDPSKLEDDLKAVTDKLNEERIGYRVFRTTVPVKGAKWSQDS